MHLTKLVLWCILWYVLAIPFEVLSSTTGRWKLTLYPQHVSWSDGVRWCLNNSANLLTVDKEKNNALAYFVKNKWQNECKNHDLWIGLFLQYDKNKYKWQGNCTDVSTATDWSNWKNGDSFFQKTNKPCTVVDDKDLRWKTEQCDKKKYQVCEEMTGKCTFEDVTEIGKCAKDMSSTNSVYTSTFDECKQKCATWLESGQSCWSVTFDLHNSNCYPSFSYDPFAFETLISCTKHANVSIRRCFEESIHTEPFPFVEGETVGSFPCSTVTDTTALHTTDNDMTTVVETTTNYVTTMLQTSSNDMTTSSDDTTQTTAITKHQNEQTTSSISYTSTETDCCICSKQYISTKEELEERIKHIENLLKVDKSSTSKAVRKRECAVDNRPTSRAIGWSGAILIAVVPLLVIIADASNLKMILESNQCRSKTKKSRRRSYVSS